MNPYQKQPSGTYKTVLYKALLEAEETELAEAFNSGQLKLAIVGTITGNVNTSSLITAKCIEVLNPLLDNESVAYYHWGLKNGQFIVASSFGAFVYDKDDKNAKEYVEKKLRNDTPVSFFT